MFSLAHSTVFALAVVSCSAGSIPFPAAARRHHVQVARAATATATPPAGWATSYLEPYLTYHTRYLAVGCENKHNTSFFDQCCHPLLATETLEKNRPAYCAPGATAACPGSTTSSSAAIATATKSTDDEDEGDDCDDEGDNSSGNTAVTQPSDSNDDDDEGDDCDGEDEDDSSGSTDDNGDDEDDGEDCDDGDDGDDSGSSTVVVTSTTSTHHATTSTTHTTPKTTSTPVKVKTTTAEAKTTTTQAKTTTKATTADTSTKTTTSSSSGSFITGGFGTWFLQNGVAGACGKVHADTDFVVALPTKAYANGANCGRHVNIVDIRSGQTATALVADECPSCDNDECLDMSKSLFEHFEALSVGLFDIKYQFTD